MKIIGLMSGTSLDGLDILYCDIKRDLHESMVYEIIKSTCIKYTAEWFNRLSTAIMMNEEELTVLHKDYGRLLGKYVHSFIHQNHISPSLIASHGHTVFHQPNKGITLQIGDGQQIANATGIPTIYDFRTQDVQLGGQGAPLVPIGDQMLFGQYTYCLNLGGFSNISYHHENRRIAYDIGPCNLLLNHFCTQIRKPYDDKGNMARSGQIIEGLFDRWNNIPYFKQEPPKSLGVEWLKSSYLSHHYDEFHIPNILHTAVEHIAYQIGNNCPIKGELLITGGGVFNTYLIERISHYSEAEIIIPKDELINNKEALIFALLGYLKFHNENNILASVTGASKDHSSGIIAYKK